MIRPLKEKPIVTTSPFDVTLLSRVFLGVLGLAIVLTAVSRFGPVQVQDILRNEQTQSTLISILRWLDLAWTICALFAAYWSCVVEEGLRRARRVTLVALAVVLGTVILHLISGIGPTLRFTNQLGARLPGGIPIGLVLLWTAILLSIRGCIGKIGRLWPEPGKAASAAILGILIAFAFEYWMARSRGWWLWTDPANRQQVVDPGWTMNVLWGIACTVFMLLTPRQFQSRDTNGGWIILVSIAMVPLLIGACRGLLFR